MAANACLKYPLCVEWITEVPYENTPRKIAISLLDFGWFLKLICDGEKEEYRLILRAKENVASKKPIMVTTYILDTSNDSEPTLIDISKKNVDKEDNVLWRKSRDDISKSNPKLSYIGKFTINCVFHSIATNLEKTSSQLSTQSAFLPSSLCLTVCSCNSTDTDDLQMLSQDFAELLKDKTLSDVQLKCEDRSVSAHRCFLAARSTVFAAMFRNKMAEEDTGVVDILDMDPEVLEMLLYYMYSGIKPNLSGDTAPALYEAADKYDVRALQKACSDWMLRNLTVQNCVDVLKLADRHSDESLIAAVAPFVAQHTTVLKPERCGTFKKLSECANETLEKFIPGFPLHGQNLYAQRSQNQSAPLLASNQYTHPQQLSASTPIQYQHLPTQNNPFQQGQNISIQPGQTFPVQSGQQFPVQIGPNYSAQPAQNMPLQFGPNCSLQPGPNYSAQPGPNYSAQPGPNYSAHPAQNMPLQFGPNCSLQPVPNHSAQPGPNYSAQPAQNMPLQFSSNCSLQPGANYSAQSGPNYSAQPVPNYSVQSGPNYSPQLPPAQNYASQSGSFGLNYYNQGGMLMI